MALDLTKLDEEMKEAGIVPEDSVIQHAGDHACDFGEPTVATAESSNNAPLINLITMDDIVNHVNDPTLQLVGDGHIIKGKDRVHVIAGYAGVGKSRGASYLAYCGATGKRWFEYEVKHKFKTLFIQSENGMTRLKEDLGDLENELKDHVFFVDAPRGFDFSNHQFRDELRTIIEENNIGVVVIDPWTNLVPDIGHKEFNLAIDLVMDCMPMNPSKCPAVMIVAHCRKPDGKGKIKRGSELMHEVYGSHVLTSRSRFVMIMERVDMSDETDDRILTTCAKANDAQHMPKGCHIRGKVIFSPDDDFDWDARESPAKTGIDPRCTLSDIVELMPIGEDFKISDWQEKAKEVFGFSRSRFCDYQKEAINMERVVKLDKRGWYRRVV
jgi:hypothetical protein